MPTCDKDNSLAIIFQLKIFFYKGNCNLEKGATALKVGPGRRKLRAPLQREQRKKNLNTIFKTLFYSAKISTVQNAADPDNTKEGLEV